MVAPVGLYHKGNVRDDPQTLGQPPLAYQPAIGLLYDGYIPNAFAKTVLLTPVINKAVADFQPNSKCPTFYFYGWPLTVLRALCAWACSHKKELCSLYLVDEFLEVTSCLM